MPAAVEAHALHDDEALALLPQALVMPVTYALLTPLALFTLDSASWETRGHDVLVPDPDAELASSAPST